jgi:hypothetical protein
LLAITLLTALTACRVKVEEQFCPVVSETPGITAADSDIEEPQEFTAVLLYQNGGGGFCALYRRRAAAGLHV